MNSLQKVEIIVKAADDRLGKNIVALDVQGLTPLADYFVIISSNNERQLEAVVESIVESAREAGIEIKDTEGRRGGRWILIDMYDVIVHVFHHLERNHYNLENIWQDAPFVELSDWIEPA